MVELSSLYLSYSGSTRVIPGQLDGHPVTGPQPGEVGAETVGDVSEDLGPVLKLDPKDSIRERLQHDATNEFGRAGHERRL